MKLNVRSLPSGKKKLENDEVGVKGLTSAKIIIEFDETSETISSISFNSSRPNFKHRDNERFKLQKEVIALTQPNKGKQDIRHIQSVDWIKEELKTTYEGKSVDAFVTANSTSQKKMFPNISDEEIFESKCRLVAEQIGQEYVETSTYHRNAEVGDSTPNRVAGQLIHLLKPYIQMGKAKFESSDITEIEIPRNKKIGKIYNFYKGLTDEFGNNKIPVDSWDMLLELFYQGQRDNIGAEYGSDTYKRDENKYLSTYEKYGRYSCHATVFQPKEEVAIKRQQTEGLNPAEIFQQLKKFKPTL